MGGETKKFIAYNSDWDYNATPRTSVTVSVTPSGNGNYIYVVVSFRTSSRTDNPLSNVTYTNGYEVFYVTPILPATDTNQFCAILRKPIKNSTESFTFTNALSARLTIRIMEIYSEYTALEQATVHTGTLNIPSDNNSLILSCTTYSDNDSTKYGPHYFTRKSALKTYSIEKVSYTFRHACLITPIEIIDSSQLLENTLIYNDDTTPEGTWLVSVLKLK